VDDVSFAIAAGETVALVGESGSGKSMTAQSLINLLPGPSAWIAGGRVIFEGADLLQMSKRNLESVRGNSIGFVYQDHLAALDPTMRVGNQLAEPMITHLGLTRADARAKSLRLLERVGFTDAELGLRAYPFELSGGMGQRVMIAIAIACSPRLLIADEPTSALDVTVREQILELLDGLRIEYGLSMLLITHDLGLAAGFSDRICVMYAGQLVENGPSSQVMREPQSPYTIALLESVLTLASRSDSLHPIRGVPPDLHSLPPGCRFAPRCDHARSVCTDAMPQLSTRPRTRTLARCWATEPGGWLT
jgi:oligopeptide transport system ATP-binding protein